MSEALPLHPPSDVHEVELRAGRELEGLPGVAAAAVWLNRDGELRDAVLHIAAGTAPAALVSAATHVLDALQIPADPAAIRLVPLLPPDAGSATAPPASSVRFLVLQDLELSRAGNHVSCRVLLMRETAAFAGEARELDTPAGRARAAATATLRAAEGAAHDLALGLEAAAVTDFFGRRYAIVAVEAAIGRRSASLCGMVAISEARPHEEYVCLATLRAIDRWLAP
jgi:hypothetical protein